MRDDVSLEDLEPVGTLKCTMRLKRGREEWRSMFYAEDIDDACLKIANKVKELTLDGWELDYVMTEPLVN